MEKSFLFIKFVFAFKLIKSVYIKVDVATQMETRWVYKISSDCLGSSFKIAETM